MSAPTTAERRGRLSALARHRHRGRSWAILGAAAWLVLAAGACRTDDSREPRPVGDGSLGTVEVPAGEAVQIRSVHAISGASAASGLSRQRAVEMAIADYGPIRGFEADMGTGLDSECSADGGRAAAQAVAADDRVIGFVGTSCSVAAAAAAPIIAAAGMVMISPSNTSPSLTSDLAGAPGENHHPGYYRTAHNDLIQGAAVAQFVYEQLGLTTAAAIHDGDPYTQGLAQSFSNSFEALGGETVGFAEIDKEDTDMAPALAEVAAGAPQALFLPLLRPAGDFVASQARGAAGLEEAVLIGADALLTDSFLALPQSEGMYLSGPDLRYGANANQSTGKDAEAFLTAYESAHGSRPGAPYWAHAYDAATLLLEAIEAASYVDGGGSLIIDRAGVRQHLDSTSGYRGITGTLACDDLGDCGAARIVIIGHDHPVDIEASKANIVFEYAP